MDCNFEYQHLDYIVIRPWILAFANAHSLDREEAPYTQNHYTAHLLPEDVREETAGERRMLTADNFANVAIPHSPTQEDLDQFCELALDGYPGIETKMTHHDICIAALDTIGFFPTRWWSKYARTALENLRDLEMKLRPRGYTFPIRGEFDAFDISKALEDGNILELVDRMIVVSDDYNTVDFECVEYFARHPYVPLETLEACAELSVGWFQIARHNSNAAPILERVTKLQSDGESQCIIVDEALQGPNAITYNYQKIEQENKWIKREVVEYLHCPHFVETWMEHTGKDADEYDPSYFLFTWKRMSTRKRKRKRM
jgi:hypothetical protein